MDRKLNVLFTFLLVIIFIAAANTVQQWHIILGFILASAFSFLAFLFQHLTLDGMFAAIVVGTFVLGLGGWPAVAVLLLFFVSSAVVSSWGEVEWLDSSDNEARRDGLQVWANGFWLVISFVLMAVWVSPLFVIAGMGALAGATADTWGTEVGFRKGKSTYLITDFRSVPPGTDGGISVNGTVASLLGSAAIGGASIYFFSLDVVVFFCIFAAGFLGSLVDSYFGAIFQRNNSSVTLPVSKYRILIDNNIVNGISTGISALLAIILKLVFL